MRTSAVDAIVEFNRGRDPHRLQLKYRAMRASAFAFLRGTCHLFYEGLPAEPVLRHAPLAWLCGDLHLENFGAYRGDNRLAYFDLNDFDEACLAPCTWDPLRLLASVFVAGDALGYAERDAVRLGRAFLAAWRSGLLEGKARWIERSVAEGPVRTLFKALKRTKRRAFLEQRTRFRNGRRTLVIDGRRALRTQPADRRRVVARLERFAQTQEEPGFYRVLDVANRIAGTGSLGVERYAVLVEGRGSPDGNFILDLKAAQPSAVARHVRAPQPPWSCEAERVVTVQHNVQAIAPACLAALRAGSASCVLRELQPIEHRLDLAACEGSVARLEAVVRTMGRLAGWGQVRSAGWRGSALREELAEFCAGSRWNAALLELARQRARRTVRQWSEYRVAFDEGALASE